MTVSIDSITNALGIAWTLPTTLLFACLAFVLEWTRVTNTSLIPTRRDVLRDLKSIIKSASNAHDFVHTINISEVATAIATVKHTTTSVLLDALKLLLLYYVLFTYALRNVLPHACMQVVQLHQDVCEECCQGSFPLHCHDDR